MAIRNPFVWLCRFRHRRGYGIHSPFAFELVTQVLYCPGRYYADEWLDLQFSIAQRVFFSRRRAICRLLFRLANYWQPSRICAPFAEKQDLSYLHQGCMGAELMTELPEGMTSMLVLKSPVEDIFSHVGEGTILVVDQLRKNKAFWKEVQSDERTRVTFDLYDVGIAFFEGRLKKQDYIINW